MCLNQPFLRVKSCFFYSPGQAVGQGFFLAVNVLFAASNATPDHFFLYFTLHFSRNSLIYRRTVRVADCTRTGENTHHGVLAIKSTNHSSYFTAAVRTYNQERDAKVRNLPRNLALLLVYIFHPFSLYYSWDLSEYQFQRMNAGAFFDLATLQVSDILWSVRVVPDES